MFLSFCWLPRYSTATRSVSRCLREFAILSQSNVRVMPPLYRCCARYDSYSYENSSNTTTFKSYIPARSTIIRFSPLAQGNMVLAWDVTHTAAQVEKAPVHLGKMWESQCPGFQAWTRQQSVSDATTCTVF